MLLDRRVTLVILVALLGCGRPPSPPPPELIGTWTTEDLRYEDRHLRFDSEGMVHFGQAEGREYSGVILEIEKISGGTMSGRYRLLYRDGEGMESSFEFNFYAPFGLLMLDNPQGVMWKKESQDA